jgi:hypothetical protein
MTTTKTLTNTGERKIAHGQVDYQKSQLGKSSLSMYHVDPQKINWRDKNGICMG